MLPFQYLHDIKSISVKNKYVSFSNHFVAYHKVNSCFIKLSLIVIFPSKIHPYQKVPFIWLWVISQLLLNYLKKRKRCCLTTAMISYSPWSFMSSQNLSPPTLQLNILSKRLLTTLHVGNLK